MAAAGAVPWQPQPGRRRLSLSHGERGAPAAGGGRGERRRRRAAAGGGSAAGGGQIEHDDRSEEELAKMLIKQYSLDENTPLTYQQAIEDVKKLHSQWHELGIILD